MATLGNRRNGGNARKRLWCAIPVCCAVLIIISFTFIFNLGYKHRAVTPEVMITPMASPSMGSPPPPSPPPPVVDRCSGRYIYVHDLPGRFNSDMISSCRTLSKWTDMCPFVSNAGLGPRLNNAEGVFYGAEWYATNQFALELIFHNRMKQYECLTTNSSLASAIFVPFYAGLDIGRYLWGYNTSVRDATSRDLIRWLKSRPEWSTMGGRDHFMVAGRITWDFRRLTDDEDDWGSKLLVIPEGKNMTVLVIESSPWHKNDFGIPYPTYFHPSKDSEVQQWQERMRRIRRPWLFSFAGAPRPNITDSIRNEIIGQCRQSRRCKLLECDKGRSKCHSPSSVMGMFQRSIFCLQPQGDSYTRRSTFDAMVAGCVPVFFHPGSAYAQYVWHLPRNHSEYSVLISEDEVRDGKVRIEEVLERFGKKDVMAMREEVIRMIPRLVYADPRTRLETTNDAFDVTVEGVIQRVKDIKGGRVPDFSEQESWKYALTGRGGEHEWDHFFNRTTQ
ncbi:unnamed protein product [Musa acuminata subsp. burmannicoides]